jgi:DNA-binding NtrC family response regulator
MRLPTMPPPARIIPLISIDEGTVRMRSDDPVARMPQAQQSETPPPLSPHRQADRIVEGDERDIRFRLPALPRLREFERQYILHVLDACGGDKMEAAHTLGIARSTLYRRLGRNRPSELGLDRPS